MTRFKVGDRVRVTGDTWGMDHDFPEGHVGTVTDVANGGKSVEVDGRSGWWVYPNDLADPESSNVSHPAHYTWLGGIEVIDITEQFNFRMGNALKYIMRADHKGRPIEDLKKAIWYIQREVSAREKGEDA